MDGIKLTEEHIVFQVDAVAQVLMKLSDPAVEGTPGIAGTFRGYRVSG